MIHRILFLAGRAGELILKTPVNSVVNLFA